MPPNPKRSVIMAGAIQPPEVRRTNIVSGFPPVCDSGLRFHLRRKPLEILPHAPFASIANRTARHPERCGKLFHRWRSGKFAAIDVDTRIGMSMPGRKLGGLFSQLTAPKDNVAV
jgi:hypothetical protein